MSEPRAIPDLPARDPDLPRFAWLLAVVSAVGAAWVLLAGETAVQPRTATDPGAAAGAGSAVSGAALFVQEGCGACHATVGPSTALGPTLTGALAQATARIASPDYAGHADSADAYLREASLDHCVDLVPGYDYDCGQVADVGLRLGEGDIDRLIEYIAALPGGTQ